MQEVKFLPEEVKIRENYLKKIMDENFDLASNSIGTNSSVTNGLNGAVGVDKAGAGPLLLKILVPAYAAGSIIG